MNKCETISDITLDQLKLRPIIYQTGTYINKVSKVVAKYLGPLAKKRVYNKRYFKGTLMQIWQSPYMFVFT